MNHIDDLAAGVSEMQRSEAQRAKELRESQLALPQLLSGESAFVALKQAVDELARSAPPDHDVLIEAFNLAVREVVYIEPHTLLFRGINQEGNDSFVISHFSQLIARVIYRPKKRGRSHCHGIFSAATLMV